MTRSRLLAMAIICWIIAAMILIGTDAFGAGQTVEQWEAEMQAHPPRAQIESHYRSPGAWTDWNRFWFASAIGGQAADAATTIDGVNGHCHEVNPLFGEDPDEAVIVGAKVGLLLFGVWIAEHVYSGRRDQNMARNWVYGALAVTGVTAAAWNAGQDCE